MRPYPLKLKPGTAKEAAPGLKRAAIIALPRDEIQAEEIIALAKELGASRGRKVEDAPAMIEELKRLIEAAGANTHELMPSFSLNCRL